MRNRRGPRSKVFSNEANEKTEDDVYVISSDDESLDSIGNALQQARYKRNREIEDDRKRAKESFRVSFITDNDKVFRVEEDALQFWQRYIRHHYKHYGLAGIVREYPGVIVEHLGELVNGPIILSNIFYLLITAF